MSKPPKRVPYAEWVAMGPKKAAAYTAKRLGLDADRKRKLQLILEADWNSNAAKG